MVKPQEQKTKTQPNMNSLTSKQWTTMSSTSLPLSNTVTPGKEIFIDKINLAAVRGYLHLSRIRKKKKKKKN